MWRPEGWQNPYDSTTALRDFGVAKQVNIVMLGTKAYETCLQSIAYETGADAMLQSLRNVGVKLEEDAKSESYFFHVPSLCRLKGTVVFIPDEEGK